jgi:hypothetical protein
VAGKWVNRFNPAEMAQIMPYVGPLCQELGYLDESAV